MSSLHKMPVKGLQQKSKHRAFSNTSQLRKRLQGLCWPGHSPTACRNQAYPAVSEAKHHGIQNWRPSPHFLLEDSLHLGVKGITPQKKGAEANTCQLWESHSIKARVSSLLQVKYQLFSRTIMEYYNQCLTGGTCFLKSQHKYFKPCLKLFSPEAKTTHTQTDQGHTTDTSSPWDYEQLSQRDFDLPSRGRPMPGLASTSKQIESPSLVQTHPLPLFKPS